MVKSVAVVPVERVESRILLIRGCKVLLDSDLAELYEVSTKALSQAVKRNIERFPEDFVFQLERHEKNELVTNCDRFARLKHSMALPYAFTEHGAIMAASVLNSPRAVEASIFVVRAFVGLREILATHKELAHKLAELERKLATHDAQILALIEAIRQLAVSRSPRSAEEPELPLYPLRLEVPDWHLKITGYRPVRGQSWARA
jgi:hypothetical protein